MNDYKVYLHIFPNGKRYVGITKQNLDKRFSNGKHYKNQIVGKAMKKYGWDNIEHKVVSENLTQKEACNLEQKLILKYKSNQSKYGYNRTIGGDVGRKSTYMCSDAVAFVNTYKNSYPEMKKIIDWWNFICEDSLEAKVFNQAYWFVNNAIKTTRTDWWVRVCAINVYLEAWQNNWTPKCAEYNALYVLEHSGQIISNCIFNKNNDWKKKELIKEDIEYAENSPL